MRIGAALAEAEVVLEGEELLAQRRAFVRDRAARVVAMREGRFAFYPGDEYLPEVLAVETPALAPILEGTRRSHPIRFFLRPLRPHLDAHPSRAEGFSQDLAALGLDTDDLKIAMQMNGRFALRDLLAHGRGDLRRTASLVWFLQLTQALSFSAEPLVEAGSRGPEALVPRKLKPLPPETVAELRDAAVRILASSYFGALGVPITAELDEVERAFREVAPRFHSDSYPENDTAPLQDLLDSVQEKITAAYRVLSQPEKRTRYLQHLLSKLELPRSAEVDVEAERAAYRGGQARLRQDARSAAVAFEEAIARSPKEAEFYACLAWAHYLSGGNRDARVRAAQRPLRKALSISPWLERAQVLWAVIELEAGDVASARRRLLKVLELKPASKIARAALHRANR
jgi:curved DNA-binding protein CbpA